MNVYTQATAPAKWEAQGKVVKMVLRGREQKRLMGANGSQGRITDSRYLSEGLVAGAGFEPATFGL
jgi:hypothetical protein